MTSISLIIARVAFISSLIACTFATNPISHNAVGGVFAMDNNVEHNHVYAYARGADGKITLLKKYPTHGRGAMLSLGPNGSGSSPLISANSLILTPNRRYLLVVNAGSNTVSVFRILHNFLLRLKSVQKVKGHGPNSIAYYKGIVYVSSVSSAANVANVAVQEGVISGYKLTRYGKLIPIKRSSRMLDNRPSAIQFSPDGRFLMVTSFNAGSIGLASRSEKELVVYKVHGTGILSRAPVSYTTSTLRGNHAGRNLPNAIGFQIIKDHGAQYAVVTETRVFLTDGTFLGFGRVQTGSISTWKIDSSGHLHPVQLDVLTGRSMNEGSRAACWIAFSKNRHIFWVSNTLSSTISSYKFHAGKIYLINEAAASGSLTDPISESFVDMWISDDGRYLYQLLGNAGTVNVYRIAHGGYGAGLTLIQSVSDLPRVPTQGIVAF